METMAAGDSTRGPWIQNPSPARRRTLAQTAARLKGGVWAPLDALLMAVALVLAQIVSARLGGSTLGTAVLVMAPIHALGFVLLGLVVGLYDWNVWRGRRLLLLRALAAALLATTWTLATWVLTFEAPIGRRATALTVLLTVPFAVLPRYALWVFLSHRPRRLLFAGDSALQRTTRLLLQADPQQAYHVVGQWPAGVVGGSDASLVVLCAELDVDEVVLPGPQDDMLDLLGPALQCLPLGCRVRSVADFYEDVFRAVPVDDVTAGWLLSHGWDSSDHLAEASKRVSDVLMALVALLAAAPLLCLAALAVRAAGDGPTLFKQWRVGRYGQPFRMLKFRTMSVDAEHGGAQWARLDDERQTRVGRWLRRSRLDELPQLFNILRGEMSFVGPRPERPEFTQELEETLPFYGWRHLVRPGLTGWAQIQYRYGASVADARRKLEYDLYYLRHYSLFTDLTIVLRTLTRLMKGSR
jgi:exopolysaccharide biosynthesis polyprenyl glycosylphosphotransferase